MIQCLSEQKYMKSNIFGWRDFNYWPELQATSVIFTRTASSAVSKAVSLITDTPVIINMLAFQVHIRNNKTGAVKVILDKEEK